MTWNFDAERQSLTALVDDFLAIDADASSLIDLQTEISNLNWKSFADEFIAEKFMERIAWRIRRAWYHEVNSRTDSFLKSPEFGSQNGISPDYAHERFGVEQALEKRFARNSPEALSGWTTNHLIFSSGMAAITCYAMAIANLCKNWQDPILYSWPGYYETSRLFAELDGTSIRWRPQSRLDISLSSTSGMRVFHIEPVSFCKSMTVFDLDAFRSMLEKADHSGATLILVDSTVCSHTLPMEDFLRELSGIDVVIAQVESGLKLYQQGLEFENFGISTLYSLRSCEWSEKLIDLIKEWKCLTGSGLSARGSALLDVPFVTETQPRIDYARQVYSQNRELASLIRSGGIFAKVTHSSLDSNSPWAESPFVFFQLRSSEALGLVLGVLTQESRVRNLTLFHGQSFGFRSRRFEGFFPYGDSETPILRVSMGARSGPSAIATAELLNEISSFENSQALQKKFPDVTPLQISPAEG